MEATVTDIDWAFYRSDRGLRGPEKRRKYR